ncbi:MAG: gliding motility protein GldN [Bacteroidia bacterium]|nr:gliding motility protein GldN [Bacteroidia bacterium]
MKRLIFLLCISAILINLMPGVISAQNVLNGIYIKERDVNRKPVPYPHLREADVMWSKEIQRKIDLRENINHPLYYPTRPIGERMSLIDLLLYGIKNESMKAYDANGGPGDEFKTPITWTDILQKLGAGKDTTYTIDIETGERKPVIIDKEMTTSEVKQYIVKEIWYFDRKYSTLQVRIVALCPIREFFKQTQNMQGGQAIGAGATNEEESDDNATQQKLFWISYNDFRPLLANHEVFNTFNDAEHRTFDDVFFKRKFSSFIVQESNVYDNRDINEYSLGSSAVQESERIKNWIFTTEHDLWEY